VGPRLVGPHGDPGSFIGVKVGTALRAPMPRGHEREARTIASTSGLPATRRTLAADLSRIGLAPGSVVLVHSSLSALGWVVGGSEAVVLALEDAVGDGGTLMMPAYSENASEPSLWVDPPVPSSWWESIRSEWPPFDRELSPTLRVGEVPETFRHQHGTLRSEHPRDSFCARGPMAETLLAGHRIDSGMGEGSPLARLYDQDGFILLLGVDHSSNSSLHLAEHRASFPAKRLGAPVRTRLIEGGREREVTFQDLHLDSDDFGELGRDFESETRAVRTGPVGHGTGRLMRQRAAVDYAVRWIEAHRRGPGPTPPATT
jgi:aminoglycoside 3-N-acetyltransferase